MVARVFEEFWSTHTLNLGGSIFSLVCLAAFLSCGGRNPLRKYLFVYNDGKEHQPAQRVLHWCICALALNILLLLSGLPDVPVFMLMATGEILDTEVRAYAWQDAALYFAYWWTLDWVHFGIVFTLNSALTPKAIERTSLIGVGFACLSAGLTTLGFCLNYYLPAEVTSTFTMDAVDLLQNVLTMMFYVYWICQNRVRRSFGAFVWYNLITNVLQFIECLTAVLDLTDETLNSALKCRFIFRSALLGLSLVYAFHTDAKWFGTEAQVPEGVMFPKAFSPESFSRICKMLDKYSDFWVHVSELRNTPTEEGEGGNGVVRQMELRAFICGPRQDVAVKFFLTARENYSELVKKKDVDNISSELKFLLAAQGHHNIVKLHGFCLMPPQITLVTEWCGNGTLATPLGKSQGHGDLMPLALQCAKAVYWLHSNGILHRDLKPDNFLMQGNTVKLVDFGNACSIKDNLRTYVGGTAGYEAPEVIRSVDEKGNDIESKEDIYSTKSDVFALGMVLWHIGACDQHHPMVRPKNAHEVSKMICAGHRPLLNDIQKDMPDAYRNMVNRCWAQDKNERPEAKEVAECLEMIIKGKIKGSKAGKPAVPDEWLRDWLGRINFREYLKPLNRNGFFSKEHILVMSEESLREIIPSLGDRDRFREAVRVERRKAGLDGDQLAGPLPFHPAPAASHASSSSQVPENAPSRQSGNAPPRSGNAPPRVFGNEPPRVSGNAPPRVSGNAPPRVYGMSGDAPPRSGNAPPRVSGNAPPRVSGNAPPRVSGSAPPRVSGSAPPRVLDAPVALDSSRGLSGNAPPIVLVSSPATGSAPFFAPS